MKAIWSPHTGIVDWALVTEHYGKNFRDMGGSIYLDFEVKDFDLVDDHGSENHDKTNYPVRVVSEGKVSLPFYFANNVFFMMCGFFFLW